MKQYIEKNVRVGFDMTCIQAVKLCGNEEFFCLYENGKEISVGTGRDLEICVTRNSITVIYGDNIQKRKNNDLCKDLKSVLDSLEVEDWRIYGIVNFSLARYIYGLDAGKEEEILFRLFIPSREYRITGKEVTLRAFTEDDILVMEKKLQEMPLLVEQPMENNINKVLPSDAVINYDENYYKQIVHSGVKEITEGNYQKVILSREIPISRKLNMKKTFIEGRSVNTPARSYICKISKMEVVGFSPETVAEVNKCGVVCTFPLAGTRALTKNLEENRRLREELLHDTKEIAEHAISVKLAEEELQQICEENSVMVTEFMSVMERGTVQHLGSRLKGQLNKNYNSWHALCKLFPAVTASGIPKKEAIEAIGRIEKEPRGLYSGSVLIADKDGYLDAALVLRSIFQTEQETWVRVGAGIVEASNPEREFIETQEKVGSVAKQLVPDE